MVSSRVAASLGIAAGFLSAFVPFAALDQATMPGVLPWAWPVALALVALSIWLVHRAGARHQWPPWGAPLSVLGGVAVGLAFRWLLESQVQA